jgi:hypothetical protein
VLQYVIFHSVLMAGSGTPASVAATSSGVISTMDMLTAHAYADMASTTEGTLGAA